MTITTGILLFDGFEELDAVGPWEVWTMGSMPGDTAVSIAERPGEITAAKGMRFVPEHHFDDPALPALDVLVVPGGQGTRREATNEVMLDWIAEMARRCTWTTSVCTGSLLLHAAGVATGKTVTTHWAYVDELRARGNVTVRDDVRWVRDGTVVTSAGVSAGIDMALWVLGQVHGPDHARATQRLMEYDPAPPYAAAV
jgi:transcriptional regulator GlxA family with amidase domain